MKSLALGQSIVIAVKHTDLNPILPHPLSVRESILINTRLDTMWTFLSQLGLPVEAFIFSNVSENGESRTAAKIVLTKDYYINIDVKYIEPLESYKGKTDSKYSLYKGTKLLAEGAYITDIKNELKALPICKPGIVTQNQV